MIGADLALVAVPPAHRPDGFSLIELLLGMLLIAVVLLSVSQLLMVGVAVGQVADDVTVATSLASEKLEQLKAGTYDALIAGGSLGASVDGYSDLVDPDGVAGADYARRWSIADHGASKQIEVRVIAARAQVGPAKEVTVGVVVARQ